MTLTREDLLKLQNGSDVRGVAIDGLGEAVTLTEEAVNRIAGAFVKPLFRHNAADHASVQGRRLC